MLSDQNIAPRTDQDTPSLFLFDLQVSVVISHNPVLSSLATLFQTEDLIQVQTPR